jgi:hypothetical protein
VTSSVAQLRIPFSSDYSTSKFTLGRLVEFAALGKSSEPFAYMACPQLLHYTEYPELRIFVVHPGMIPTTLATETGIVDPSVWYDTVALPAATMLAISTGKAEWLRGRSEH